MFGLNIPGTPWKGSTLSGYQGFQSYLAHSINSYQVNLNFLSLAARGDADDIVEPERNDEGKIIGTQSDSLRFYAPWRKIPELTRYGFSESSPVT